MKHTQRFLAAILALTLGGTICACGEAAPTDDTTAGTDTETTTPETTAKTYIPDLPEKDFEGRELKILVWERSTEPMITDFCVEEETGDALDDAVYRRNRAIEDRYNVELVLDQVARGQLPSIFNRALMASEYNWDIVDAQLSDINTMTLRGFLYDLNSLDYLDFSKEWWDTRYAEQMSIAGRLYSILGDINLFDDCNTWSVIYNKDLAASFQINDLYDRAFAGTWTLDYMYELAQMASSDLDGDGDMDEKDRWGLLSATTDLYFHFLGAGESVAGKNSEDLPELTLNTERGVNVLEKAHTMMNDASSVWINEKWTHLTTGSLTREINCPMFMDNRVLLQIAAVEYGYTRYRDMTNEFGMLPMPKYDEKQEEYYNGVSPYWATALSIPVTCPDPDFPAFMMEALAAESVLTMTQTFNNVVLQGKALRDEESMEIMMLIKNSRTYDIGYLNDWGGMQNFLRQILDTKPLQFSSAYASRESSILNAMNTTIAKYQEISQ